MEQIRFALFSPKEFPSGNAVETEKLLSLFGRSLARCVGVKSLVRSMELKFYSSAKFYSSVCHADEGSIYSSCVLLANS